MKQVFTTTILILLVFTGCKQQTCMNPYAYTYENNVTPNGGKFDSTSGLCKFSTPIFYFLAGDSALAGDSIFPVFLYMDGKQFSTLTTAATTPGNIDDPLLPRSIYAPYPLTDGGMHRWVAILKDSLITFNDSIRANHLQFIPVSITGK